MTSVEKLKALGVDLTGRRVCLSTTYPHPSRGTITTRSNLATGYKARDIRVEWDSGDWGGLPYWFYARELELVDDQS